MRARLRCHLTYGGTGAYAANTIRSADIVDGEVRTQDLAAGGVTNAKLANNAVTTGKVTDSTLTTHDVNNGTLSGADVSDNTLGALDIAQNAVGSSEVANGTLQSQDFAPGTLGTFRAYGRIASNLTFSRSKNVVSVHQPVDSDGSPLEGVFCITLAPGIDPRQSAPVATPDHFGGSTILPGANGSQTIVEVQGADGVCTSSQLEVRTGRRRVNLAETDTGAPAFDQYGHPWVRSVNIDDSNHPFFFVLP
jgi:hypothetical protein